MPPTTHPPAGPLASAARRRATSVPTDASVPAGFATAEGGARAPGAPRAVRQPYRADRFGYAAEPAPGATRSAPLRWTAVPVGRDRTGEDA